MGIYTLITAVILPILVNFTLNICILVHVRKSSRRIQPQPISTLTSNITNNQPARISRRDISLLKQMIFMFTIFILGWAPVYIVHIADIINSVDTITLGAVVFLSEICLLSLVINLIMSNYEIRQFLFNKIRRCFCC